MKQTLRFFILVSVFMFAVTHLTAQQQTRSSVNPGVPGTSGYTSQQQARGPGNPTPQNGNGTLGQIYNFSKCGLNFTQASQRLGQRFSPVGVPQPAAFAISGIPACAVIEQAYLWTEGSGDGSAQTATIVNPAAATQNFPMALVGSGPDKCWGYAGSQTYRANVTPVISGNGNYTISGLFTSPPTSGNDMDGATLMIIYSDPTAAFTGSMVIHDGAVVINGGTTTQTLTGMSVCQNVAAANATAFCMVGDIQMTGQTTTMNGTNAPFTWDWWNYVSVNTALTTGQTTAAYTMTSGGDCFNLCVIGMYFRTTCTPCTSSSLTLTPSSTPATCSNCNGTASVSVVPAGPYTYSWAPSGGNAATATGLCAGTYTVTVSNACNTATMAVTVASAGGGLTVNNAGQTNVNCFGNCNGTASVTVTGGTGPYTYAWTPSGGNAPGATGLCAGTYTCNVTDANGCTGTRTFTITQPPALVNTFSQVNVLCNGGNSGSATVTASGGTPGYTFSWAPAVANTTSGSSNTATGLAAGTYVCTITDLNGCTSTRTVIITQPPALTNTFTQVNILCNGNATGSATVTASGGSPGYTFTWAPAVANTTSGSSNTATGLAAGTYVCTITDLNGCTSTRTVIITQPPALTNTFTQVNILCNGNATGSATVTASGGSPGYTFTWAPAVANTTSGSSNTATGLAAGTYVCTITDLNGCTSTRTVIITQPPALANTYSQVNVLCNGGNNGSATVTASGGTPGYTFTWAPAVANTTSGSSNTATGLAAGTYVCTITDLNGCTSTRTVIITQPPALVLAVSATTTTCGNNNGSVTVTATGGTGTPTYVWTPGNYTTATVTNLAAGSYVVTVTDGNGCTATATATVNSSSSIASTNAVTNVLCNGASTGSATVTVTGNNGPVTYAWVPNVSTTNTATGLAAGTYVVTATDATGCPTTTTVTITQPTALTNTFTQVNVLCNGNTTGSATVTASGGTPGYTFSWAPAVVNTTSGSSNTATGLAAGTYVCTITDLNGCTSSRTVIITQPPALILAVSATTTTCGNNNGSVTVTATGGTGTPTYVWTPGNYTTATVTNLAAGSYVVTVTDGNGCTATATATINSSSSIASTNAVTNVLCNGASTGSATVTVTGNNGPVTYVWVPNVSTTNTATGLAAGTYVVTATDATGCPTTTTVTITQPTALTNTFTQVNVLCNGNTTGSATVTASGGTPGYTFTWAPAVVNTTSGSSNTATGLTAGTYVCTITDLNGCTSTRTVIITQPPALVLAVSATTTTCGNNNGSVTVTATGGTGTPTYVWTPGNYTTATVTNLAAGSYVVTVTDGNGCTATATATVNSSSSIASTNAVTNVLCNGASTGSATVTVTGNNGPVTYVWVPNVSTTNSATGLAAGTYVVTATDATGCPTTTTVTIIQPTALTNTFTQVNVLCNGNTTGSATVTASGGTPGYTFTWAPAVANTTSGSSNTATGLAAGTYVCTITDLNGCISTQTVIITQPPALTVSVSTIPSTCGNPNGSMTATVSGGTGSPAYLWTPSNATTATVNNVAASSYTVLITDANNCTTTAIATVNNLGSPTVNITSFTNVSCFNGNNASATALGSGGSGPLSYIWTNGDTTTTAVNLNAGTFTVTVTDQNNCTDTATVTITQPTQVTAAQTVTNVSCFGGNNGTATMTGNGGTGTYTFAWTPSVTNTSSGNSNTGTGLIAGTYLCTVTDSNGCSATQTMVITEPPVLAATLASTNATCFNGCNGTLTSTATGGTQGYTYNWSSGCNTANCSNVCAGTYILTVTDTLGCTFIDSVVVTEPAAMSVQMQSIAAFCNQPNGYVNAIGSGGTGNLNYVWNPGNLAQQSSNIIPPGNYTVTVTDQNNCSIIDSVSVANIPGVTLVANPTTSVSCYNGTNGAASVTATGGTGPYTYAWTPNVSTSAAASGLAAGNYVVIVADSAGCTSTVTLTVTQPVQLTTTAAANPGAVCQGQSVTLSGSPFGGTPGYTGVWTPGNLTGLQQTIIPTATTTYTLSVTDLNGCTATAQTTVTVNQQPAPQFTATPTQGCAPLCVNFTDQTGTGSWIWNWDFGDGNTGSGSATPTNCYNLPGSYDVQLIVTDATTGCTDTVLYTNFVNVFANPVAAFGSSPDNATMVNPTIFFTDSSTAAASWNWSFGDLLNSSSAIQNPSFTYPGAGCYEVTLTVTSIDGCTSITSDSVCIGLEATLFVPNAFTPDGDGDNDIFLPVGIGLDPAQFEFWIYDRWGNMIFFSDNPTVGWDGRANNGSSIAQIDTYVWKIKCVDVTGRKHNKLGTVTLIK